ncbi:helicase-related protein [Pseudomonas entomophila]|uniref:DEAD/DEAH box helicase n=1 Tax=Pseudomonas entomophila TaxID=312306 RepID=UPI0023D7BBDF|nr:DEAD/DEAH box helicase [Pseudomonas entomophila]MDF0731693.1 helicase-related protein [Pseudomonas entomophila]
MDSFDLISLVAKADKLDFDSAFDVLKSASELLVNDKDPENEVAISILENRDKFPSALDEMFADLIESYGLYPYLQRENLVVRSTSHSIRVAYHQAVSGGERLLHEEQKYIYNLLARDRANLIVSAPTSFGKSLIIEELVASGIYRNVVIIQPTLALLDETRRKLNKYSDRYKLVVRTSQEPSDVLGNIYLLTAERVNEYKHFVAIDLLVMDEFYKLSARRDDERSDALNNAFYFMLKSFSPQFYLLGPNIDGISAGFNEKYNSVFYKSDYKLVLNSGVNTYEKYTGQFGPRGAKKKVKERALFSLLDSFDSQQTIIYCSSPARVRSLARAYLEHLQSSNKLLLQDELSIISWIEINVDPEWVLIDLLKSRIGIHDGALQKHITNSMLDFFERGKLDVLFCTSTIIEGVNTSAKNVIFYDDVKGADKPVDYFDYSNIKGRAGRMMQHYSGVVYNFNPVPEKQETIVDIPFYEQSPISDEVLIQLEGSEVNDRESKQYQELLALSWGVRELVKANHMNVQGQLKLLDYLREVVYEKHELLNWSYYPSYDQLQFVIELACKYLALPGELVKPMSPARLTKLTYDYGRQKSIYVLIRNMRNYKLSQLDVSRLDEVSCRKKMKDILDDSVREGFQVLKHWFQYKIPKWLSVVSSIQEFVCREKGYKFGSYSYYASQIENDFIQSNLSILDEYGVPSTAAKKLEGVVPDDISEDKVLKYIRERRLHLRSDLLDYERDKIIDLLDL